MWELNGGSILAGESSLDGIIRELKEELGVEFSKKDAIYFKDVVREKVPPCFKELWVFRKDIDDREITFPDGEAIDYKWVTIEEFMHMYNNKEIVPTVDFGVEDYNIVINLKQRESYGYIGNKVKVKIDRPLNSRHPRHGFVYEVNYGFVPNTISEDGEELDCYVLGVDESIDEFEGVCIAVIHRTNDDDDKLIVVPKGMNFSDEEIRTLSKFQEQFFESEIIR